MNRIIAVALIISALCISCSSPTQPEEDKVDLGPSIEQLTQSTFDDDAVLISDQYISIAKEMYQAALNEDAVAIVQLCRQMDNRAEQDANKRHDHDILVAPCNDIIWGGNPQWIAGRLGPDDERAEEAL